MRRPEGRAPSVIADSEEAEMDGREDDEEADEDADEDEEDEGANRDAEEGADGGEEEEEDEAAGRERTFKNVDCTTHLFVLLSPFPCVLCV